VVVVGEEIGMAKRRAICPGAEHYFVFRRAYKTTVIPGQPTGLSPESITPVVVIWWGVVL
jgi:hypothetical protein